MHDGPSGQSHTPLALSKLSASRMLGSRQLRARPVSLRPHLLWVFHPLESRVTCLEPGRSKGRILPGAGMARRSQGVRGRDPSTAPADSVIRPGDTRTAAGHRWGGGTAVHPPPLYGRALARRCFPSVGEGGLSKLTCGASSISFAPSDRPHDPRGMDPVTSPKGGMGHGRRAYRGSKSKLLVRLFGSRRNDSAVAGSFRHLSPPGL